MSEITITLITGLNKFGKEKTFNEILTDAGYIVDPVQRIDMANELEGKGIIESVTYKLPFEIRAELTDLGKKIAQRSDSDGFHLLDKLLLLLNFYAIPLGGATVVVS